MTKSRHKDTAADTVTGTVADTATATAEPVVDYHQPASPPPR